MQAAKYNLIVKIIGKYTKRRQITAMSYLCLSVKKKHILTAVSAILAVLMITLSVPCINYAIRTEGTPSEGEGKISLPIIMYHQITTDSSQADTYVITCEQLESDFKYISESGYTSITAEELYTYVSEGSGMPDNPIIITFDDGCESFYNYAVPLLEKYNLKAVMSVVGSFADRFTTVDDHNLRYSCLNWDQITELTQSGIVEIANHTYDMHNNSGGRKGASKKFGESDEEYRAALVNDVKKMQDLTFKYTDRYPVTFTFPYGAMSKNSRSIISDMGFSVIFTCEEKVNQITSDPACLLGLGRYNRSGKYTTEKFFNKIKM